MTQFTNPKKPCAECPWRRDVPTGRFSPARFADLARTAYDMNRIIFACHKSTEETPTVCAGFLLRGAAHNLTVRLRRAEGELLAVEDGGYPLFDNFREMAIANGVPPFDPVLQPCRDDQ